MLEEQITELKTEVGELQTTIDDMKSNEDAMLQRIIKLEEVVGSILQQSLESK